jgi:hypothetical protein
MAASVRMEDEAFSDIRYDVLANVCQLADSDHARGKMAALWRQCTALGSYVLSEPTVRAVLGANAVAGLIESELGERVDGGIRIRGTRGRIEWLKKLRKNASKGGKAKAAKRQGVGKQEPSNSVPPPCPPAPAPSPVLKEEKPPAADDSIRPAVEAFDAYFRDANGGAKPTWGAKQIAMLKTLAKRHTVAEVVRRIESLRSKPPSFPPQPWDLATFISNADRCAAQLTHTWTAPIA